MGRVAETAHCVRLLRKADDLLILITGEKGVGKTRFLKEIAQRAKDLGFYVLFYRSRGWDRYHPFATMLSFLRSMMEKPLEWIPKDRESLVSAVEAFTDFSPTEKELELLLWLFGLSDADGYAARLDRHSRKGMTVRVFDKILKSFIQKRTPLLLALDDIHQSDSFSAEYFLKAPIDERVVLAVTVPSPTTYPIQTGRRVEEVTLNPFSEKEVRLLLESRFGKEFPAGRFAPALFKMTHGNPLYLVQLLAPIPVGKDASERLEKIVERRDTSTLIAITERIRSLDSRSRTLLEHASVVSERFPVSILKYMLGIRFPLKSAIRNLQRYRLAFIETEGGTPFFCFGHTAVQEATLSMMDDAERERLSGVAAEALKHHYGPNIDRHLMTIAEHYEKAGERESAIDLFLKAGERFLRFADFPSAEKAFRAAIRLSTKKRQRLDAMVKLIGTFDAVYKLEDCLSLSKEFFSLSPPLHMKARVFVILTHLHVVSGSLEKAVEYGNMAIDAATRCRNKEELATGYSLLAIALATEGRLEDALKAGRRGYELARRLGDERILGTALNAWAVVNAIKGNRKDAYLLFEKSAKAYRKAGYLFQAAQATGNMAIILREMGEYERAVKMHMETVEAFEEMGAIEAAAVTRYYIAVALMLMGEYRKGLSIVDGLLPSLRRLKSSSDIGNTLVLKASFLLKAGRLEEAESALRRGWNILRKEKRWKERERVVGVCVESALLRGKVGDALKETFSFLEEAKEAGSDAMLCSALALRLRTLLASDDIEGAGEVALSIAEQLKSTQDDGTAALLKSSLLHYAARIGDTKRAERLLAEAAATGRLPAENYAEGLLAVGETMFRQGARDKAREYLLKAEEEFASLVEKGFRKTELERVRELLKKT